MKSRFFGAILLLAGTAIGAGMLALPIVTGFMGFFPSFLVIALCCGFLYLTSLIFLDVNLSIKEEANIISMAGKTLGKAGKIITWFSYLFLFYSVEVAFLAGGTKILKEWIPFPEWTLPFLIIIPLGAVVLYGMKGIDIINRLMTLAKFGIGYLLLVIFLPPHVSAKNLEHFDFSPFVISLPIIITIFIYHSIIPTLVTYLNKDVKKLRWALFFGSIFSLLVYLVWEYLVLGVVPLSGEFGLIKAWQQGEVATTPIYHVVSKPMILIGTSVFAIFAIGTAFLGVTTGLFDFIIDGLKMKKDFKGKITAFFLTFTPPLVLVYSFPRIFIQSLEYAGSICALLFGILPVLMAWRLPKPSFWCSKWGRTILVVTGLFFVFVFLVGIFSNLGFFKYLVDEYIANNVN